MTVTIASPHEVVFEGEATKLVVPTVSGITGILPRHQAMITQLDRGELKLHDGSTELLIRNVYAGLVEVRPDNHVVVLLQEHMNE